MRRIKVIDSHTAGEPTRVVVEGGPTLGRGSAADQLRVLRAHHDRFRSAVVNEPRGSDVVVGASLVEPQDRSCAAGVIFFNNVGYLGMCGHGLIGVVTTLAHLRRLAAGTHRIETPVGVVTATLHPDGTVAVQNVRSHRLAGAVRVEVPDLGVVVGDVAWGGNWFFLTGGLAEPIELGNVERLTALAWRVRQAVNAAGFPQVDHIELFGPPRAAGADARNFVLCPGKAYDRSPCGTGTSAKLACLAAEGRLAEGRPWVQEGILGTSFSGSFRREGEGVIPTITGAAFVTAESTLLLDERDPFCWGIQA